MADKDFVRFLSMVDWLVVSLQLLVAFAMLDVWLIRYNSPGFSRGGDAKTMAEEFRVYGLPDWFRNLIRVLKLAAGGMMVLGIWWPECALISGSSLSIMMIGAMVMHFKVRDPIYKVLPSAFFGLVSFIVFWNYFPNQIL